MIKITPVLFLLLMALAGSVYADSDFPSCFHVASDQDGDGFGYENEQTCTVDESTRSIDQPNICVDDNADGYGWNGVETCLVETVFNPMCEDTEPLGDGWGWNGTESCRVVPQTNTKISELEILKKKLVTVGYIDRKVSAFYCPSTDETVYLEISGFLFYFVGPDLISQGVWSTGMFDKDHRVTVKIYDRLPRTITLQDDGLQFGFVSCS